VLQVTLRTIVSQVFTELKMSFKVWLADRLIFKVGMMVKVDLERAKREVDRAAVPSRRGHGLQP